MKIKVYFTIIIAHFIAFNAYSQNFSQDLWQGNVENIKEYIDINPKVVNELNQWGLTPIHVVIAWGHRNHKEIIDALLDKGADINQLSEDGKNAIHYAVESAPIELIQYLIERGADISVVDEEGNSSLFYAVLRQDNNIINLVYNENIELPVSGEKGRRLLLSSVSCGNKKITNKLIADGASLNVKRGDGATLLHCAAEGDMLDIIDKLLDKGFYINTKNKYFLSPLHLAVKNNNINAVNLLIEKGADINIKTNIGLTPYHIALENEYVEITNILAKAGADTEKFNFNVRGKYFGQKPPGNKPEIFAPGIVSTMQGFEFGGVFTPDNKEFFFTQRGHGFGQRVRYLKLVNEEWTNPDFAPFTYDCFEYEPGISPDGETLVYGSRRPLPGTDELNRSTFIWKVKKEDGWKNPILIGGDMMYVTLSSNQTLYTTNLKQGAWGIIKREFQDGKYGEFINLGDSINFMQGTAHPYIAPDESYIIFDAQPEEYGENGALFISYKKSDGSWTKAKAFGDEINFGQVMTAWVSHDQKYLFYHCTVDGYGDIYWVDASIIDELKPKELK